MKKLISIVFCIYIFLIPLIPFGIRGNNYNNAVQMILLIVFILYIYLFIKDKNFIKLKLDIISFFSKKVYILMVVFLLLMLLSTIYAEDKSIALKESMRFFTYIIIMFMIDRGFNKREREKIIFTILFISFTVSILGIVQYFTGIGAETHIFSSVRPRVQSTLDNPNTLGAFQVLMLFPLISITRAENKSVVFKVLSIVTSVMCFINLIMSMSRSAMMGFAIGLVLLLLLFGKRLLLILIPVAGIILAIPSSISRIKQITDSNQNESRIRIWNSAIKMIKEQPYFGVGNGNFIVKYPKYTKLYPQFKEQGVDVFPSHNSYLKIASELGIVGELSFWLIIIFILREAAHFMKNKSQTLTSYFIEGFLVGLIPFLFMNCFDNILFVPKVSTFFWIMVAMLFSYRESEI
ncbi:O-antigen ligase family protein [Clostridium manihotivorum]|uniref:Polymerase n=1 Tax=Clostridium manihotivorum TaxID=2320868 RepID=A0A3R5U5B5_9CLOT|nr:O-antigen ligase family protein [Clostridium manihotivorum]QAA32016.1 polymerase [Clostridium manihotivorum]